MSTSYLEKFRTSLPLTQGNQILKILISERDSGKIKNLDEFRTKLKDLTAELLAERIKPTFELFKALAGEDTSSEQYNFMLERIADDLEAAFAEADTLDSIIEAHHNAINKIAIKSLRYGINELESQVTLYEFLNKSKRGFDNALFNTFRESQTLSLSRIAADGPLVFLDPRKSGSIGSEEDAYKDLVGERITLGSEDLRYIKAKEATWLSNDYSIRSELDVGFPDSNINNIIDEKNNTYWVVPLLLSDIRSSGVYMEVVIRLPSSQDINFVEIEPASIFPINLVQIDYYDGNNIRRTASTGNVTIDGPTRVNFPRATSNAVVLRFLQYNYRETQFRQRLGESNFHRAVLGQNNLTVDKDSINEDLREILTSDFILNEVMGRKDNTNSEEKYYEYVLGFDNIKLGFNTYKERSIFVSKKQTVDKPGQVALRVTEVRPTQVAGESIVTLDNYTYPTQTTAEDAKFYHGSTEYWLTIKFFSDDDFLISSNIVPILPLDAYRIYHELVVFTRRSTELLVNPDKASLMFYTDADSEDVIVYRNGTILTYGAGNDWVFVDADDPTEITHATPNDGHSMRRGIQILDTVRPLDIYTVSYTPVVSNTAVIPSDTEILDVVDLIGDQSVRVGTNNIISFETTRQSHTIAKAEMYLVIIMRRNSANLNVSPAVEEYMLITGSRNENKFIGEF